jgi:dGTPase
MAAKLYKLKWTDLLSTCRVRSLFGGPKSRVTSGDLRTEFERDYGRTVYSTPFRRLRDKAQVFPLEPNDSVRTRLLHSLEVSSVAEDLAAQCVRDIIASHEGALSPSDLQSIPLVAATCGLVHDIGNPPFGHAGELAMQTWAKSRFAEKATFLSSLGGAQSQMVADFFKFEGNAQGTRTISNTFLLADGFGLNFTAGTMAAALKYVAASNQTDENRHETSKPGFFASENDIVAKVREITGTLECRHPIAYLLEAADDLVYSSVDLEDGIRRGTLAWQDVQKALLKESGQADIVKEAVRHAHAHIRPARLRGKEQSDALAQAFRVAAISLMVIAARKTFRERYADIMNGEYHQELLMDSSCEAKPLVVASKHILRNTLYRHSDILRLEVRGREVIHKLLDLFWEAVSSYEKSKSVTPRTYGGKLYLLFSPNYRRTFEKRLREGKENELYCRLQLVTDQVAGMTDTYACRLHTDLTNR